MCGLMICALIVSAIAFCFGLFFSLFMEETNLFIRLMVAAMPAAMAFVATWILGSRDYLRHHSRLRAIQQMLLARDDVSANEFIAHFPTFDRTLMIQIRRAISRFFDVPDTKIHPGDELHNDFQFEFFDPDIQMAIVYDIADERNIIPQAFYFGVHEINEISDLAIEVQRILDSFDADFKAES